jgi:tetratricopeptide (TPR) repeat protein
MNDTAKANEYKEQGNEYFKKKEYAKAIEYYSKAISKI